MLTIINFSLQTSLSKKFKFNYLYQSKFVN